RFGLTFRSAGETQMTTCFRLLRLVLMVLAPASAAALPPFDQVSIQSVDEATRHNAMGLAKATTKDWDGAIAEYSEAIRLDPNFADAFYNRGLAREDKGNLDDAIQDFSRAIALNPRHALAYTERGSTFE